MVDPNEAPTTPDRDGPFGTVDTLTRLGIRAWMVVGIGLAVLLVIALLAQISGLVVPLVIASVMGALLAPLVDRMERARVPRGIGSGTVLLGLFGLVAGSLWIVVAGLSEQAGEISAQLTAGLALINQQLSEWGIDIGTTSELMGQVTDFFTGSAAGLSSLLSGLLSNVASFVVGTLVAVFLLFYVLLDWHRLTRWVSSHLAVDQAMGNGVVDDAVSSIRQYFGGLTISAVVTSVLIGASAALLDVPLAFAIALVTLVTSYVPYLGAIVSGAFATLIALGAQGPTVALIMLVVILVVQNVVQTLVLTRVTSDSLSIHPMVNLGSTIIGATLAGILGATLSAPLVAMVIRVRARLTAGPASGESGMNDDHVATTTGESRSCSLTSDVPGLPVHRVAPARRWLISGDGLQRRRHT